MSTSVARVEAERQIENMEPEDQQEMLLRLLERQATDPATMLFPPLFPIELALKTDTVPKICGAHGITKERFEFLIQHPVFIKAYQQAIETLKTEGAEFKVLAQMQARELISTSFKMAKNPNISDSVRADLIKSTVRWAGYDKKAEDGGGGSNFNIQINLG